MTKLSRRLFLLLVLFLNIPTITVGIGYSQSSKKSSSATPRRIPVPAHIANKYAQRKEPHNSALKQEAEKQKRTMPGWLIDSSIKNAPPLLRGILCYLESLSNNVVVPSFHRFILVGPPGTGKTTLARVIAHILNYETVYVPATSLIGRYRNQTAVNIKTFFKSIAEDSTKKVVIIDELHKLFEQYGDERSDNYENAAAFWLMLDMLEKDYPNILIIGTANDASKLPPEIKSRFHGKTITMSLPDKKQKLQAFRNLVDNDCSIKLDDSVDSRFIISMIKSLQDGSLRDVQLIIDTAKMFKYSENDMPEEGCTILHRIHFEQALAQLNGETKDHSENFLNRVYPDLRKWSLLISVTVNVLYLSRFIATPFTDIVFKTAN